MAIELIAEHLKVITGLDSCSVGISVVEQAVKNRMLACDVNTHIEYYKILQNSKDELNLLIDKVMVPETWFFRGSETFRYLREHLANRASSGLHEKLRILTIPCATGEEPYSIAITLSECGYAANEFNIDAIDIANESIKQAKEAIFTEHSFRGADDLFKQQYFKHTSAGYKLNDCIKNKVTFLCGNIFDLMVEEKSKYDIVFCRNLLIYFDKDAQHNALKQIDALMADDGVLFIGHGEAGCIMNSPFTKIERPNAFAFSKVLNSKFFFTESPRKTFCNNSNKKQAKRSGEAIPVTAINSELQANSPVSNYIEEAIRLADEGRLEDAIAKCKESISVDGVSADSLCLLGVIHDANGNRFEAVNYYNRAIHLTPDHYQSLMHLASHAERNGEKERASDYRDKAMMSKSTLKHPFTQGD